ncbi:predicted protein, partial [Nematostella vectensis]
MAAVQQDVRPKDLVLADVLTEQNKLVHSTLLASPGRRFPRLPNAHRYADDTQIYPYIKPSDPSGQEDALRATEVCISEVRAWMISLKINDSMTELLVIGSPQQLENVNINKVSVGSSEIKPVSE